MISLHQEIEAKLEANPVDPADFIKWVFSKPITGAIKSYKFVTGPDHYFENEAGYVVRHRDAQTEGLSELTTKRRKSDTTTRDRLEVDLQCVAGTNPNDVHAFFNALGFKAAFTLVKEAYIIYANITPNLEMSFVIYDVWRDDAPDTRRRFIEIEASKGSTVTPETAKRHVNYQVKELREKFGLNEPLNDSLYELYSGKKYQKV